MIFASIGSFSIAFTKATAIIAVIGVLCILAYMGYKYMEIQEQKMLKAGK